MPLNDLPAPAHRRRKDARPHELLEAALALFVEKGFAATKAEEVAQLAGVSKGTLYRYFPSKEELLKAVIEQSLSARIAEGAALVARHMGSTSELLQGPLVQWWCQLYDSPASGVFKLVVTEARTFPDIAEFYAREVVEPAEQLLYAVMRAGIQRGEFRDVDVNNAVHSLILPLVMVCVHRHSLGACPVEWHLDGHAFIRDHVRLVLLGLAGSTPTPPPPSSAPTTRPS